MPSLGTLHPSMDGSMLYVLDKLLGYNNLLLFLRIFAFASQRVTCLWPLASPQVFSVLKRSFWFHREARQHNGLEKLRGPTD